MKSLKLSKSLLQEIAHIFFPQVCSLCNRRISGNLECLCLKCFSELPFVTTYYRDNETELALMGRFHCEWAFHSLELSKGTKAQNLIHKLKYEGKKEIGIFLGKILGDALVRQGVSEAVLLPVPITEKKKIKRGYNQAEIIAQGITEVIDLPIITQAVVKVRESESQTKLSRSDRQHNLLDVFEVRKPSLLANKTIVIVDDILTTGATVEALVKSLIPINNIRIIVIVAGKAVQRS